MQKKIDLNGPLLLDTCAWIWLVDNHHRIAKSEWCQQIESSANEGRLYISPISTWEIATKVSRGKLSFTMPLFEWIKTGKKRSCILDAPFNDEIAIESTMLPGFSKGDPADKIIIATARIMNAVLITGDSHIIEYSKNGHLNVWQL